jgi:tRNA(Met) cytidine acetyltransferase
LKAGGLFFLLCPPLHQWPNFSDEFAQKRSPFDNTENPPQTNNHHIVQRLLSQTGQNGICIIEQTRDSKEFWQLISQAPRNQAKTWKPPTNLSDDQQQVMDEISKTFTCQSFCHVISSDRGRGKSHLLGKLLLGYLNSNKDNGINYYITAPTKSATESIYKAVNSPVSSDAIPNLNFLAPEKVLAQVTTSDVLFIDEAASLPIAFLIKCSNKFNKVIFASTTHGYEGTGKGFQIRFFKHLNSAACLHTPCYHTLNTAIRYADNDPLENWLFNAFCLSSEPNYSTTSHNITKQLSYEQLDQKTLSNDSALLEEVFGLLIQAHYQTRPSDLRDILDAHSFRTYALFGQCSKGSKILLSVCLLSMEGPILNKHKEDTIQEDILNGFRRPKGHLIPQVLCHHMAIKEALNLSGARVVRIATLPNLQNQNLASKLLQGVINTLKEEEVDYIGSSFASTPDVSQFWAKNTFKTIRIGNKQDGASGTHSALVFKGLTNPGLEIEDSAFNIHTRSQQHINTRQELTSAEIQQLDVFINKMGSYESAKDILKRCQGFTFPFPKKANKDFKEKIRSWLISF